MGLDDDGYTRPPNPDKYLAGDPSRRLVKQVRSDLARYGIKPQKQLWRMTWQWAHQVQASYIWSKRKMWPAANEVAAQYVFLLLKDMQTNHLLKLPYRAGQCVPQSVADHLAVCLPQPVRLSLEHDDTHATATLPIPPEDPGVREGERPGDNRPDPGTHAEVLVIE